jgi:hypothetical protein
MPGVKREMVGAMVNHPLKIRYGSPFHCFHNLMKIQKEVKSFSRFYENNLAPDRPGWL